MDPSIGGIPQWNAPSGGDFDIHPDIGQPQGGGSNPLMIGGPMGRGRGRGRGGPNMDPFGPNGGFGGGMGGNGGFNGMGGGGMGGFGSGGGGGQ